MPNASFQPSADARLLVQHMQKAHVGQVFSYEDLSNVISRGVDGSSTALRTALRRLLRDHDMVFACIKGEGVKRLNDAEIVAEGGTVADAIRRKANRSVERQMKADFSRLSREQQGKFTAQVSVMASIAMMTKSKQMDRIAEASPSGVKELPIAQTLAMFSRSAS